MKHKFFLILLFITSFGFSQTLLNENFSGQQFPPLGWQLQSVGTGNNTWYNVPGSSVGAIVFEANTIEQNEILNTPSLNLSTYTSMYLNFTVRLQEGAMITANRTDFFVKVSTDNGANWTTLWTDEDNNYTFQNNQVVIDISNYTGAGMNNVKFQFQYTSIELDANPGSIVQLYNVTIGSCPIPNFQSNDPIISWTTPSSFTGTYDIEYGAPGFEQGTGTLVTGLSTNSFSIPNMSCNNFSYFLRSNCGSTTSSWSLRNSRFAYSTPSAFSEDIAANSILLRWNGFAANFDIEYGPTGFTPGTGTLIQNIPTVGYTNTYLISGLNSCTSYTFRIKATCHSQGAWLQSNPIVTKGTNTAPYTIPFTETFNETLCELNYWTNQPALNASGSSVGNRLFLRRTTSLSTIETRRFNVVAGVPLEISYDLLSFNTNPHNTQLFLVNSSTFEAVSLGMISEALSTTQTSTRAFIYTPNFTGEASFRVEAYNNDTGLYIDNLKVTNCTSLVSSATVIDNTIHLNILNNSEVFEIAYGLSNQTFNDFSFLLGNSSSSLVLSNLQNCSNYRIFIRANCNGEVGNWIFASSQFVNFSDDPGQNIPYDETFSNYNPSLSIFSRPCDIYWQIKPFHSGGAILDSNVLTWVIQSGPVETISRKVNLIANHEYLISYNYKLVSNIPQNYEIKFGFGLDDNVSNHSILKHYDPANNTGIAFSPNYLTETITFTPTVSGSYNFSFFTPGNNLNSNQIFVDTFSVTEPLSISSFFQSGLKVYPNPVNDILNISSLNKQIKNVQLVDLKGRVVYSQSIDDNSLAELNIAHLTPAVYLLQITTDEGVEVHKVIKK